MSLGEGDSGRTDPGRFNWVVVFMAGREQLARNNTEKIVVRANKAEREEIDKLDSTPLGSCARIVWY